MSESSQHSHDAAGHGSHDSAGQLGYDPFPRQLVDAGRLALLVGGISIGLLLLGFLFNSGHAFRSLLFAFNFWLSVSLGCMGFVMISHLTGGGWGAVIRRFGEAGFMNLPLMLVVFLFLSLGYKYLFPWAHLADFESDKTAIEVMHKRELLYTPFTFTARTLIYFVIWMAFAFSLRAGSLKLDKGPDLVLRRKLRIISAGGMVLFFVTTTGYAMDYILSRETCWYSSIIGFIEAIAIGQCGMAFMSINVCWFAKTRPIKDVLTPQHTNDLGNILLALIILFVYTNFAQFLIQWNGNIPEDVGYFTYRGLGVVSSGWKVFAAFLLIFGFFGPFFLLLMKGLKRDFKSFSRIAALILFMQIMYGLWLYAPSGLHRNNIGPDHKLMDPSGSGVTWTDLVAFVGIGGLWLSSYLKRLSSKPLLALNVADQPEIIVHGTPAHA
jgi:hypothetical protein